jgi:hypothetical protein
MRNAISVGLSKTFSAAPVVSASHSSKTPRQQEEFLRKVGALLGWPIHTPDPEEKP